MSKSRYRTVAGPAPQSEARGRGSHYGKGRPQIFKYGEALPIEFMWYEALSREVLYYTAEAEISVSQFIRTAVAQCLDRVTALSRGREYDKGQVLTRVRVIIKKDRHDLIVAKARQQGVSKSYAVRECCRLYLEELGKE